MVSPNLRCFDCLTSKSWSDMPSDPLKFILAIVLLLDSPMALASQHPPDDTISQQATAEATPQAASNRGNMQLRSAYILGPDDQITIQALEADEISNKPTRIDGNGNISLPMVGRLRAAGLTIEELEAELTARLKTYIQQPEVAISVTEFRSQPVSVIGAVNTPGVQQLQGHKTLFEILSMAGGLRTDAGHSVKITRRQEWGPVPLPSATKDSTGRFSVAEVNLQAIMQAKNPEENILVLPNDVISVPRAEIVYVIGEVKKAGGFVLNDRETVSVLEALALAEGLGPAAAANNARILRTRPGANRTEIPVDLKKMLSGKTVDIALKADDILVIPNSATRKGLRRFLENASYLVTNMAIYRTMY